MALNNPKNKIIRFIFAGLLVTLIYIAIGFLLLKFTDVNSVLANGIAFVIANLFSYMIHTLWSFSAEIKKNNFLKFYMVSLAGFSISIILPMLGEYLNADKFLMTVITSLSIPLFTFILHNSWTYKLNKKESGIK